MTIGDLADKKILVLGLGVNNRDLAVYLLSQGLSITVRERDEASREKFSQAYPDMASRLTWETEKGLGGLTAYQVIFRSPGIPYLSPEIQAAKAKGVVIYSQTKLFLDICPCPVIGVTGTKGKGTTSTLIYQMLSQGYEKGTTYLAGNIGADPFSFLEKLQPHDLVILELSSFQLQDIEKAPPVAVMLGMSRDHLDHHKTMEEYVEAKGRILAYQQPGDLAVVNDENTLSASQISRAKGTVLRYGKHLARRQSAWVDVSSGEEIAYVQLGDTLESLSLKGRKLLGEHNLENILPALLVCSHFGVPRQIMQKVAVSFAGLPHRLSHVGGSGGVDFYDDSISTTPEAAIAALRSFPGRPIHLIAGGNDKGSAYDELAMVAVELCASVSILPGEAGIKLKKSLKNALRNRPECSCLILDKATDPIFETLLSGIHPHLKAGDVVLLSPAAASFASFANYKERGDLFSKAVTKRYLAG